MKTPNLDRLSQKRSDELSLLIRDEITQAGGYLSFARFMDLALYTPQLGYYCSDTNKFGKSGDFVTAPELSPLFAQSIARQSQQIFNNTSIAQILEIGAGTGKLAQDLLLELERLGSLPSDYFIFEKSEILRIHQRDTLKNSCGHLLDRVHWVEKLPTQLNGIILANEVIDALPVHCFKIEKEGVKERCVAFDKDKFHWHIADPTTPELTQQVNLILKECDLMPGYQSEVNLTIKSWIHELAHCLEKGVILLFDYGYGRREYYHPERTMGTLMCFYQHHHHDDPFQRVGLQDITAHVDFTAIVENGIDASLNLGGYTTQSGFLLASGLMDIDSKTLSALDQFQQNQMIKKLTFPSEMGELIKVIALTKNFKVPLLGFSLFDRRKSL